MALGVTSLKPVRQVTEPQSFALLDDTGDQVLCVIASAVNARGRVHEGGKDGVASMPVAAHVFLRGFGGREKRRKEGFPCAPILHDFPCIRRFIRRKVASEYVEFGCIS